MVKTAPPQGTALQDVEPMKLVPLPPGLIQLPEDPVRQTLAPLTTNGPTTGLSFEGIGQGQYGFSVQYIPPDTNGTVGATQYVQWVNASFAIFDKATGNLLLGPVLGNTLWSGFGGGCQTNNNGDPVVTYDKLANRWVMSQFSVGSTPYLQCIAVSQTSDATGAWYRYSFSYGNSDFDDYPKMGVWPDAYYETFDMFLNGQTYIGPDACAYDRNSMLAGLSATQQCFQQSAALGPLLPSDLDGTTPPPTGSPNYMLTFGTNTLNMYKFHVDWVTPANSTFTGPTVINVAAFSPLCGGGQCVPEPGSQTLDSLGDRLMHRLAYRNFGTHESLVVNHSVTAGSSGGVRWYEIQNPSGTPVLAQQSTYAPDSNYRWMGSVAMDQAGDLAVGYSESSSSVYPSVAYAGRLATDPVNTLQAETLVVSGTGSQNYSMNNRWGDYSAMQVDPVDDCTFWYTQEYIKTTGSFNWNTRIANFKFSNCGSSITVSPTSLTFGGQLVGTSSTPQSVTLSNTGSNSVTINSIGASGDFSQTNTCGTSLAGNSSCTISVTFTPTASGTRTGTLTISDSSGTQTVGLTGTGTSNVSLTPVTLNFGNVGVGNSSSPQAFTLSNGNSTTLTSIGVSLSGTNAADFTQTNNCGTSLAPSASCTINVTFTPSVYAAESATLTVTDSVGTQTSSLSGTGINTTPPVTQITAPANGATVSGVVTVTATATDPVGIASVQIYIDGTLAASGSSSPLNYSWNTSNVTNSTHTIYSVATDTSGNTGTSATITVTVNNSVQQLLLNTGFETGNLAYWNAGGVYLPTVTSAKHNSGSYSAQLGSSVLPEPNGDSWLYQTVTIPAGATAASLNFYYWGVCNDTVTNQWQEAQIQSATGTTLAQVMKVCSTSTAWTKVYFNLINYVGQTIRIYFNDHENGDGLLTYMYLDDVTVSVRGGTSVTLVPASVNFGNQNVGTTSASQTFTLTNSQTTAATGLSISFTGTNATDFAETDNCGTSLAANSSCAINVTFTPGATGSRSATLSVTDSAGTQTSSLTGTGVGSATLTPASLTYGNQNVGTTSSAQALTLTNGTGSTLTGLSVALGGTNPGDYAQTNNCGTSLAASSSCTINVTFTPTAAGTRTATVTVTDSAGSQSSSLTGTGVGFATLTPASLTYGNQNVGTTSSAQVLTLTNGTGSALTGLSVALGGTNPGDYAQTNNCGASLAASSSCTINVTFTPTASGTRTASVTVTDSAGSQSSSLSGTGVWNVTLAPTSESFGNQNVGTTSSSQSLTLTNSDGAALTGVSVSITGANPGDYAQTNNCGTSVAANSSCTINVTFTPTVAGTRTATLTVTDVAGTQSSSLTGTGVGNVTLTPASLTYSNQNIGTTSSPQPLTLTNGTGSTLTGLSVAVGGTNAGDFGQTNNCGTSLANNSSCTINVTFTPTASGTRTATLMVTDSAGTQSSSLSGTGTNVTLPVTQITAPTNGATVTGTVTVTATATSSVGIASVQIYIDGAQVATGTTSPLNYSWNTVNVSNGTHTIYSTATDTSGNMGMSSTISVTVSNVSQLIQNSGFETGNLMDWTPGGVLVPSVTTAKHNSGSYSAVLGATTAPEQNGDSSIYQTVTIPSTSIAASLNFYYWGVCNDTLANDWQEVQIQSASGTTLAEVMKTCSTSTGWTKVYFNLINYKGQTLRVYLNAHGNGDNNLTYMYVDDVTVSVK